MNWWSAWTPLFQSRPPASDVDFSSWLTAVADHWVRLASDNPPIPATGALTVVFDQVQADLVGLPPEAWWPLWNSMCWVDLRFDRVWAHALEHHMKVCAAHSSHPPVTDTALHSTRQRGLELLAPRHTEGFLHWLSLHPDYTAPDPTLRHLAWTMTWGQAPGFGPLAADVLDLLWPRTPSGIIRQDSVSLIIHRAPGRAWASERWSTLLSEEKISSHTARRWAAVYMQADPDFQGITALAPLLTNPEHQWDVLKTSISETHVAMLTALTPLLDGATLTDPKLAQSLALSSVTSNESVFQLVFKIPNLPADFMAASCQYLLAQGPGPQASKWESMWSDLLPQVSPDILGASLVHQASQTSRWGVAHHDATLAQEISKKSLAEAERLSEMLAHSAASWPLLTSQLTQDILHHHTSEAVFDMPNRPAKKL